MSKLNGIRVTRRKDAIFIPLPVELWTGGNGCSCGHCDGKGFWDTLAIPANAQQDHFRDTTWNVHHPELHKAEYAQRNMAKRPIGTVEGRGLIMPVYRLPSGIVRVGGVPDDSYASLPDLIESLDTGFTFHKV